MRNEKLMTAAALGCLLAAAAVAAPQSGNATDRDESTTTRQEPTRANPATTSESANSTVQSRDSSSASATDAGSKRTASADASSSTAGSSSANPTPMLMVLVPVAQPTTTQAAMRDGCWAKLYTNEKYGGDALTLIGPVDMPTMAGPFGVNWSNQIESVQTGPRTTLTIYDEERYRDRAATIRPGQEVPDLEDEKLGFFEDFRSMKISCASAPNAA
jgi:Ni/Co efflux regulator RcnB